MVEEPMIQVIIQTDSTERFFRAFNKDLPRIMQRGIKRIAITGERLGKVAINEADRIDTGAMIRGYRPRFSGGGLIAKLTSRVKSPGGFAYFEAQDLGLRGIQPANITKTVTRRIQRPAGEQMEDEIRKAIVKLEKQVAFFGGLT